MSTTTESKQLTFLQRMENLRVARFNKIPMSIMKRAFKPNDFEYYQYGIGEYRILENFPNFKYIFETSNEKTIDRVMKHEKRLNLMSGFKFCTIKQASLQESHEEFQLYLMFEPKSSDDLKLKIEMLHDLYFYYN